MRMVWKPNSLRENQFVITLIHRYMRKLLVILSFTLAFQFVNAQTGVIYNIAFRIDPELITQSKIQNQDHQILNISTVEEMPKSLSDTIAVISEEAIGNSLGAVLSSLMPEEKLIMAALPEHLMYLPSNTYKKARNSGEYDYYITINCYMQASGGVSVTLANNTYSKVKPKVTLSITVYDKDKKKVKKGKMVLKDFEKLRSHTYKTTYGIDGWFETTDEVTESETLNSSDILRMYLYALEYVF
jgi:hypothetical protein